MSLSDLKLPARGGVAQLVRKDGLSSHGQNLYAPSHNHPQRTHPHSNRELSIGTTLVRVGDTVVLSKLYCQDASLMGYLQCLIFSAAEHNFWFSAKHIPGCLNTLTDSILRNKVDLFLSQAPPMMSKSLEELPLETAQLLVCRTRTGSP